MHSPLLKLYTCLNEHSARQRRGAGGRWPVRARTLALSLGLSLTMAAVPQWGHAADPADLFKEHDPMSTTTVDHGQWADVLSAYVSMSPDGITRVDYAALEASNADTAKLAAYIDMLQATDVSALSRDEQFAFWVNLYNAVTVEVIIQHYPVASIRDISISPGLFAKGPWGKKLVSVEDAELSLDNIEHDILRKLWTEPRVHYAVNCASYGCPNLALTPYTGAGLDAQLTEAAQAYVNHPRGVQFAGGKLTLSSIYDWYGKDFGATQAERLASIAQYADPALAKQLAAHSGRIAYHYDWALNDTANAPGGIASN